MISVMETTVKVKISGLILDPVPVKLGLRHPILFNLVLEKVIRDMNINQQGFKLPESSIEILAYANNIVLLEESQEKLKNLLFKLEKATVKV